MERVFKGRKEPPAKEWCWGPKPSSPQEETSAPLGNAGVMVTGPRGRSGVAVTVGQRAGGGKDRGWGQALSCQSKRLWCPLRPKPFLKPLRLGSGPLEVRRGGGGGGGRGGRAEGHTVPASTGLDGLREGDPSASEVPSFRGPGR